MNFYRDSEGNEVDLLLPIGGKVHAIEIKAGSTVSKDYFKGLKTFASHQSVFCQSLSRGELPPSRFAVRACDFDLFEQVATTFLCAFRARYDDFRIANQRSFYLTHLDKCWCP